MCLKKVEGKVENSVFSPFASVFLLSQRPIQLFVQDDLRSANAFHFEKSTLLCEVFRNEQLILFSQCFIDCKLLCEKILLFMSNHEQYLLFTQYL